jgi:MOSC domain-containing protein YiiM
MADILGRGHIFQLNVSRGGVPKRGVARAVCGSLGLEGDGHDDERSHGGPNRALCVYALEHYLALQREGHPAFPGSLGENVTLVGLDLGGLAPGDRLAFGTGEERVEIELTAYTTPCKTIAGSFADRDITRVGQAQHPGMSRLYARVLRGGELRVGEPVVATRPAAQ